jgi:hypothetical protein
MAHPLTAGAHAHQVRRRAQQQRRQHGQRDHSLAHRFPQPVRQSQHRAACEIANHHRSLTVGGIGPNVNDVGVAVFHAVKHGKSTPRRR